MLRQWPMPAWARGYSWSVSGGTLTSGNGTSSITYTAPASGTLTLNVSVSNSFGCSASSAKSVTIAVPGRTQEGWRNKAPIVWQSSTFNVGDHQYSDGQSIPFRFSLTQMCPGGSWCIVIKYDFQDGNTSRHFYDFLDTYNASEQSVVGQECTNHICSGAPTTFPVPMDPALSYQLPGAFTVYNGTITNVSTYTTLSGSTIDKQLTITGVTDPGGSAKDVLILFGGHLARDNEWGLNNGASSFPGASAKVFLQFCGESSFGNLAVNPGGIIQLADLAITKTGNPGPLCAGSTLAYTLTVTSSGPDAGNAVTVTDNLPRGTTLVSATQSQGTFTGTTNLNFSLAPLGPHRTLSSTSS